MFSIKDLNRTTAAQYFCPLYGPSLIVQDPDNLVAQIKEFEEIMNAPQ